MAALAPDTSSSEDSDGDVGDVSDFEARMAAWEADQDWLKTLFLHVFGLIKPDHWKPRKWMKMEG